MLSALMGSSRPFAVTCGSSLKKKSRSLHFPLLVAAVCGRARYWRKKLRGESAPIEDQQFSTATKSDGAVKTASLISQVRREIFPKVDISILGSDIYGQAAADWMVSGLTLHLSSSV